MWNHSCFYKHPLDVQWPQELQNRMKFRAVYRLKQNPSFLPSNTFSRGLLKQQRSRAQSSQTLSVSDWTLFGNWQSVQRNRLGTEHPGKFHFTSEVVYLWKIIWVGVSKQRGLHRSQWLMCESWGLQPIRKSWSCLEKHCFAKWIKLQAPGYSSIVFSHISPCSRLVNEAGLMC